MSPPTQLVNLFSPNPNYTHSGRATPNSVGGATNGRSFVASVNSSGAISFDTQLDLINAICPIPCQGLLSIFDPDALPSKKVSGIEKRGKCLQCCGACSIALYNLQNS
jgi:hypothetical protein